MNPRDRKNLQLDQARLRADWDRLNQLTKIDMSNYHTQMVRDLRAFNVSHRKSMDDMRASMEQLRQSLTSMRFKMTPEDRRRNDENNYRSHVFHVAFLCTFVLVGFGLAAWMVFR